MCMYICMQVDRYVHVCVFIYVYGNGMEVAVGIIGLERKRSEGGLGVRMGWGINWWVGGDRRFRVR